MDYPLYMKNDNYYLITNKGNYYNIALEYMTFKNKLICNEELSSFKLIEFNQENIKELLKDYKIDFKDFDDFNYILFNNNLYKFNNWMDVFKFLI
jgi:hypothetical protein